MFRTAYNTTDAPVVVDSEGRSIGGGEWGTVETTEDAVKAALEAGSLEIIAGELDDGPGQNPDALKAQEETQRLADEAAKPKTKGKGKQATTEEA